MSRLTFGIQTGLDAIANDLVAFAQARGGDKTIWTIAECKLYLNRATWSLEAAKTLIEKALAQAQQSQTSRCDGGAASSLSKEAISGKDPVRDKESKVL